MDLAAGTRLGPYEIVALIGRGGMGEVYRARDTNLNRDVALKVLPDAFASDPERLARFVREAQTLATLNHPHIAHVHGFEESVHGRALVMELVEGDTLASRIASAGAASAGRSLPLDEALPLARQIVEALEAAHEKGIVHRDLKPANIMVTADGQVKVLDFGLAKSLDPVGGADAMTSPTLTLAATRLGVILGTAAYMSPEQAKGHAVDKRTDVWAFGCVLYEMLTGRRAFPGDDVTDTIAAVVRAEPDWSALPPDVPPQTRLLLTRCLEKDRRARVPDIGVARFLLTEKLLAPATEGSLVTARPQSRRGAAIRVALGLAAAGGLLAAGTWIGTRLVPPPAVTTARFSIVPPANQPLALTATTGNTRDVTISPDGTRIVYRAGVVPVTAQLAVRGIDDVNARLLPGTAAREPFMSPDGLWIGFFTAGELRKVSIGGGPQVSICKIRFAPRGASWGDDDTIIFASGEPGQGLMRVPASGGAPAVLTTFDAAKGEAGHFYPFHLPGGRFVLFTIGATEVENAQIAVLDLKSGERRTLIHGGADAVYANTNGSRDVGYLVYAAQGTLRAVRFDVERLQVASDPVEVVDHVMTGPIGQANYSLSRQGTLVYVSGGQETVPPRTLVWVNRHGEEEPLKAAPRSYTLARLSPDGTRIALDIRDQSNDIWIWDVGRQTLTPLNIHPSQDMAPLWTPDGRRIIWTSGRHGGNPNLFWQSADGTGAVQRLTDSPQVQFPTSISSDGRHLSLFGGTAMATAPSLDISMLTLDAAFGQPGKPPSATETLLHSAALNLNGEISPDDRWLAYQSNESGQFQVYVRPFPNVDRGRWQVSPDGGTRPMWARSGRELFYLDATERLTSVTVGASPAIFSPGTPVRLLSARYYAGSSTRGYDLRAYDVSPDGQRFLMLKETEPPGERRAAPAAINVVMNWFEELKTRLPATR